MKINDLSLQLVQKIRKGTVIPAHPLALTEDRKLDEKHQRALTRYYIDSGAGAIAVGVHTTQFEIRDPAVGLFKPVLTLASKTVDDYCAKTGKEPVFKIAGICGKTKQACTEAEFACQSGYHAGLLSLAALADADIPELLKHCRTVACIIPVIGFYLQPAVGGRILPFDFWRQFAEIENVLAIKIAPFNRYQTLEVIRGVCQAERQNDIVLYTGNDDNILIDLLTKYKIQTPSGQKTVRIVGGLLGHWAVWTKKAVELLNSAHKFIENKSPIDQKTLTLAAQITDTNAAFFDAKNSFKGCIAGIHEVLRRQGLLKGIWTLDPNQTLSPGQKEDIDRVYNDYPHLNDDDFVKQNLHNWLAD